MRKNILIIDDSALIRRVMSDIINSDGKLQVAGIASNGIEGLDLIMTNPKDYDAILLDINMPKMGGLEFLEKMNKNNIKIPTIVVSTVAKEGTKETIRALELGAFDFITKPGSFVEAKSDTFKQRILKELKVALRIDDEREATVSITDRKNGSSSLSVPAGKKIQTGKSIKGTKLVALACSTGGPKALQDVIPTLPKNLNAPVLLVQHMPEGFTQSLANRLDEMSNLHVKEAEDGEVLQNGVVYIAKGGRQMRLNKVSDGKYKISVTQEAARGGLKPCADIMYESLVSSDFEEITCVVLTGMGGDGTRGIKQLKEHKKIYVIAQDAATCTVYGMPKVVAEAGLVDEVQPLKKISGAITQNVGVH
ncbi:chemotaxis-specific protein-glutamate methyltransferase CheB [Velocimicrobium porci]|uniref:Protein-glutamate methylesterase/protein-glutamine glutaminase n=1 Tax=Velocimicrobium porci TaxID=2606634 RepID=A0A6L5XX17_9FIRM|nr:chemotaxis-specific protein-glutamate methyltransferase CheB [Velocimicrobium porci]MSS62991.1 chemotaxis-specific protein-glutamate methyltransferase CheB [Velocimicrobium porci]